MASAIEMIAATITALGGLGGIVSVLYVRSTRKKLEAETRKTNADATKTVVDSALVLLEPLHKRIVELEEQLIGLKNIVTDLEGQIRKKDARILALEGGSRYYSGGSNDSTNTAWLATERRQYAPSGSAPELYGVAPTR